MSLPHHAPSVSVVIPTYNYGRFVGDAVDSVLAQRYPQDRVEVIVVDDGSTDDTGEVLARYGERIRVLRRPNGGIAAATHDGLGVATGEVWTLLGADDYWPADRLAVLARALDEHPEAGIVYGDMAIVRHGTGEVIAPSFRAHSGIHARSGRVFGELVANNFISGGAMMVRSEHRDAVFPFPEQAAEEDWWLACAVARVAPVQAIDDVVSFYRLHDSNANLGSSGERRLDLFKLELPFRRWLLVENALCADVTIPQLRTALHAFDHMLGVVSAEDEADPRLVVGPDRDAAVAELHLASAALDEPDVELARRHLIRAAARDPWLPDSRELLVALDAAVGPAAPALAAA